VKTIDGSPASGSDIIANQVDKASVTISSILPAPVNSSIASIDSLRAQTSASIDSSLADTKKTIDTRVPILTAPQKQVEKS
jgi:hypothetical protein